MANRGSILPSLFDEQVRHIVSTTRGGLDREDVPIKEMRRAFKRGVNAALLGERLLCLGMTSERAVFSVELFEKCTQAYVIAEASSLRTAVILTWVRLIANRRSRKDKRHAGAKYLNGQVQDAISSY